MTLLVHGEGDSALYIRSCGQGRGVIHVNGKTYTIDGGFCAQPSTPRDKEYIRIGLVTSPPAAPARAIWLKVPLQSGPTTISDSVFQFPGMDVAAVGTVVVDAGLKGGTFSLHSPDATATTGVHLTGSWACGSTIGGLNGHLRWLSSTRATPG
jgi:hypothetical protein